MLFKHLITIIEENLLYIYIYTFFISFLTVYDLHCYNNYIKKGAGNIYLLQMIKRSVFKFKYERELINE